MIGQKHNLRHPPDPSGSRWGMGNGSDLLEVRMKTWQRMAMLGCIAFMLCTGKHSLVSAAHVG